MICQSGKEVADELQNRSQKGLDSSQEKDKTAGLGFKAVDFWLTSYLHTSSRIANLLLKYSN